MQVAQRPDLHLAHPPVRAWNAMKPRQRGRQPLVPRARWYKDRGGMGK